MQKTLTITIEGGQGSGKSTLATHIREWLREHDWEGIASDYTESTEKVYATKTTPPPTYDELKEEIRQLKSTLEVVLERVRGKGWLGDALTAHIENILRERDL